MKIKHVKGWMTGPYQEVVVVEEGTVIISSGLLDDMEAEELAQNLRDVADDLWPGPADTDSEKLQKMRAENKELKAMLVKYVGPLPGDTIRLKGDR